MKLPNPRGFVPSTFDRIALFGKPKGHASSPVDLATLYDLSPSKVVLSLRKDLARLDAPASYRADYDERKIFISTGMFKVNKKGERKEEKMPVLLQTVIVTVTAGGISFELSASNRGHLILDSRDNTRKPQAGIRADLARILGDEQGAQAADELASVALDKPRPRKPDTRVFSAPDPDCKPSRLYGHGKPKDDYVSVPADEFSAYLNANLPQDWESLPEIRELPARH